MAHAHDDFMEHILAEYHKHAQARVDAAKDRLKTEVIPRLKQWGVATVHAEYSGYGDSGAINHIAYLDAQSQPVNMDMVRAASDPQIESVLYEFLPDGFEVGDGSQGDVYIDITAGTVTLEHGENYTETRNTTREFTL